MEEVIDKISQKREIGFSPTFKRESPPIIQVENNIGIDFKGIDLTPGENVSPVNFVDIEQDRRFLSLEELGVGPQQLYIKMMPAFETMDMMIDEKFLNQHDREENDFKINTDKQNKFHFSNDPN